MLVIIEKIASIFLILAIGFILAKTKFIKVESKAHLSQFLIKVALPCLILPSMTKNTLTDESVSEVLGVLLIAVIYFTVISFISVLMCKYVYKVPKEDFGTYILLIGSNNTGFLGFPVSSALFGEKILFLMIIFNIVLTVYTSSLGPVIMNVGSQKKLSVNESLKNFFNINTICTIIGLGMYFLRLHFPDLIFNCVDTIGNVTVPLSLFIIGMQLAESKFKDLFLNAKLLIMVILKMTLVPLFMFLVINTLGISNDMKICLILGATLPTAAIITSMAQVQGKNAKLSAEFTSLSTLFSIATIPIMATILTKYFL